MSRFFGMACKFGWSNQVSHSSKNRSIKLFIKVSIIVLKKYESTIQTSRKIKVILQKSKTLFLNKGNANLTKRIHTSKTGKAILQYPVLNQ